MSQYTKSTNFATKDNLTPGDPLKIVRGTEIDTEYNNIATAIATKTDNASAAITGGTINATTIGATTASTGAFSTLSATGAITSTLATGTAPLVIASTTKVANLNVDSLDGADWASPAALGSTTPAAVSATTLTTSSTVTFNGGTANGVAYLNGSKVVTSGSALVFDGTNLGVGVTPSVWWVGFKAIELSSNGAALLGQTNAPVTHLTANATNDGTNWLYKTTYYASRYEQDATSGKHAWYTAASGTAGNAITFTQAMTLDASGNLIVGGTAATNTSSGRGNITINGSSSAILSMGTGGTEKGYIYTQGTDFILNASSGAFQIATGTAQPIIFQTDNTERARIDSSGNLLVGTTSTPNGGSNFFVAGGGTILNTQTDVTTGTNNIVFRNGNGNVGSISTSGSATSFNTSSDYRLKNTIAPMTGALAKVAQLKPVTYKWNADGSNGQGFIAHELAEVCPDAVTGEKDAVDAQGNPQYQGIDVSFLVATLTAAIKEQQAIIESLKARLDAANL